MSDYVEDIHKELYEVSKAGDCARVRELLEAGADPDKYKDGEDGDTALHRAAWNGHRDVVISLLESGANPHIRDYKGRTTIDVAKDEEIAGLEFNK